MELEADLTRGMLQRGNMARLARSLPDTEEIFARGPINKNEEDDEEEVEVDPAEIGEAAGALTEQIIGTLSGSAQDVIQLFQEVVQSVGGVLEEVFFSKMYKGKFKGNAKKSVRIQQLGIRCLQAQYYPRALFQHA